MCRIGNPVAARIPSTQPCAALHGIATAPQPAAASPRRPRTRAGSGSGPVPACAAVRSGTPGSDHSTAGIWSWSRPAGVSSVSRTMNCALANGPMPPSTPNTRSVRIPPY